jgi:pSer/pThr/pTyr-binding forkhead associated (FHA) protein
MAIEARLILLDPPAARRELRLTLPTTVGRSREAKIKLVHSQVSRVHCEFYEQDGLLHVRDLGSTNGTYVEDQRISESAIQPGQTVTIGAVKLQALYEPAFDVTPPVQVARGTDTIRGTAEATIRPPTPHTAKPPASEMGEPSPTEISEGWSGDPGETDDSLNILPPRSEVSPHGDPDSELKWQVPDSGQEPAPSTDDDDFEQFLKDLEDDKP